MSASLLSQTSTYHLPGAFECYFDDGGTAVVFVYWGRAGRVLFAVNNR